MNRDNYKKAVEIYQKRQLNPKISKTHDVETNSLIQTHLNGRQCPHCHSRNVISNGNYKGRKKYKCKTCGKNYNDLTGTPFSGIHKLKKMEKYINCMIEGKTIRESGSKVQISITTSFNWRHRILDKIDCIANVKMKEQIEMEEATLMYSAKGQRKPITEELANSKVSLVFACDRTGKVQSDSELRKNRMNNKVLERFQNSSHENYSILCSSKSILRGIANGYHRLSRTKTQISNINNLVAKWSSWMLRFYGVATKYLSNYLHWFDLLQNCHLKSNQQNSVINTILHHSV
jgi:transposase-like protein